VTSNENVTDFARRYAAEWCSQNPESVAAFFAENGSLMVNDGAAAVGRSTSWSRDETKQRFIGH
jgi:hypothetical protein